MLLSRRLSNPLGPLLLSKSAAQPKAEQPIDFNEIDLDSIYLFLTITMQCDLIEHRINRRVGSSVVEHPAFNRLVEGSNPSQPNIHNLARSQNLRFCVPSL